MKLLGQVETLLIQVAQIDKAFEIMDCVVKMQNVPLELKEIQDRVSSMLELQHELTHNRLLQECIQGSLILGNTLNQGTFRGNAIAFDIIYLQALSSNHQHMAALIHIVNS